ARRDRLRLLEDLAEDDEPEDRLERAQEELERVAPELPRLDVGDRERVGEEAHHQPSLCAVLRVARTSAKRPPASIAPPLARANASSSVAFSPAAALSAAGVPRAATFPRWRIASSSHR